MDRLTENRTSQANEHVAALVSRAQNGQPEAFGVLYEEHVVPTYRYVYARTSSAEDAEDLTQEVFLKALRGIGSYRDLGRPFASWLVRIAHNLIVDRYRSASKHRFVPLSEPLASSAADPVASAEKKMESAMTMEAVGNLPPRQKETVSLRFGAGLSIAETAEAMGKSQGAVKALQHQAVLRLRKVMENLRR